MRKISIIILALSIVLFAVFGTFVVLEKVAFQKAHDRLTDHQQTGADLDEETTNILSTNQDGAITTKWYVTAAYISLGGVVIGGTGLAFSKGNRRRSE